MLSYICTNCKKEITISKAYSRVIETRNKERVCRSCRHRDGVYDYDTKYEVTTEGRKCIKCNTWKAWNLFPLSARSSGKTTTCMECTNSKFTTRYNTDMEFRARVMKSGWESHLRTKYGITVETYNKMMEEQGGACAICGSTEKPCVDHCHTTKRVRGILCRNCNKALGIFKDSVELLEKAVGYINDSKDKKWKSISDSGE